MDPKWWPPTEDDPLAPARGIKNGILLSLCIAALLLFALAGCCGPTGIIPSNVGCKVEVSLSPEVTP